MSDINTIREEKIRTREELWAVIDTVSFAPSCVNLDWGWELKAVYGLDAHGPRYNGSVLCLEGWLVRTSFTRPDTETGVVSRGFGRWEFVPWETTESGVVKTCWLLVELIVRHECMEAFLYEKTRIFGPHNTVDILAHATRLQEIMLRKEKENS